MTRQHAFTYVELMIVLTIIAILAAIAVPNFLEAQTRSVVSRSKAELSLLKMAIDAYRVDTRSYPANHVKGVAGPYDLTILTTPIAYLTKLPIDVFTSPEVRSNRHPIPLTPIPYRYYNALQVNPEKGLTWTSKPAFQMVGGIITEGFVAGLAWGYGPGATLPAKPTEEFTHITQEGEASIQVYDPSNGTVSPGDIYQRLP